MDQAGIITFEEHEKLISMLFEVYMRTPPPGYEKVSLTQVKEADKALFLRLMEETRDGIRVVNGVRPVENALKTVMFELRIQHMLMPLPMAAITSGSSGLKRQASPTNNKEVLSRNQRRRLAAQKKLQDGKGNGGNDTVSFPPAPPPFQGAAASGTKGGGRGKGGVKGSKMPRQLIGMINMVGNKRICFDYIISGCSKAQAGGQCPKGWHLRCMPGCGQAHSCYELHPEAMNRS